MNTYLGAAIPPCSKCGSEFLKFTWPMVGDKQICVTVVYSCDRTGYLELRANQDNEPTQSQTDTLVCTQRQLAAAQSLLAQKKGQPMR